MDNRLIQHQALAQSGQWAQMSFAEQMANIGSEVSRACRWKGKARPDKMQPAFERCLELTDFTIASLTGPRRKELLRAREIICDFFVGENLYMSDGPSLQRYFDQFAFSLNR